MEGQFLPAEGIPQMKTPIRGREVAGRGGESRKSKVTSRRGKMKSRKSQVSLSPFAFRPSTFLLPPVPPASP